MKRYMVYRMVVAVWVPLTMWNEVRRWPGLGAASQVGFDRDQALRIINSNRKSMPSHVRYMMRPFHEYRNATDPTI